MLCLADEFRLLYSEVVDGKKEEAVLLLQMAEVRPSLSPRVKKSTSCSA